jgi:signal transduction histidine kinase
VPTEIVLVVATIAAAVGFALGLAVARRPERPEPPPESSPLPASAPAPDFSDRFAPADQLGIGLIALDPDGRIRTANESTGRLLRLDNASLAGRTTMEAFIDHTVEELVEAARGGTRASGEITQSGEPPRTLEVHAWPAPEGSWIALVDVSELRRLRRIRTEFVDNLAHELRTPLSTVRLLTESLGIEAERTELPPRVRESIGKIDVETGHLVQMVNELLDLARIEQGEAALDSERLDTADLVRETIARLRVYAERQGVALRELPHGTADERTVVGDEERLGQAAGQPRPQRDQVLACRRRGGRKRAARRGERSDRGRGPRPGNPGRGPQPHLRALLQGRPCSIARPQRRHGPGPRDRAPHRRAARRPHLAAQRRRRRLALLRQPSTNGPAAMSAPITMITPLPSAAVTRLTR